MKHVVTVLFFVAAMAAYIASSLPGAALLLAIGLGLELTGWYRVLRGRRNPGVPTH